VYFLEISGINIYRKGFIHNYFQYNRKIITNTLLDILSLSIL